MPERIGLISDTHDEIVGWDDVHDRVAAALGEVDLILHCGDLTTTLVLDRLGAIAPVLAVRSPVDPPAQPPGLVDGPQVVERDGAVIGLVNTLPEGVAPSDVFGRAVDVVVHGGTHEGSVDERDGVLFVNPGSPSLAEQVSVATLDVGDGKPRATLVTL